MGGLISQLGITHKMPKNKTYYGKRWLGGLLLNNGHITKTGHKANVELRAMLQIVEMADHCYDTPSYDWHALNLIVKKRPETDGNPDISKVYGERFDVGAYLTDLVKLMTQSVSRGNIYYRWHMERSLDGGYHAHVAMFINGSAFNAGGVWALLSAMNKLRNDTKKDFQLVTLTPIAWHRNRESAVVKEYFDTLGYELPRISNIKSDVNADATELYGLRLMTLNDYRYALCVYSYQAKTHTKEYEDLQGVDRFGNDLEGMSIGHHPNDFVRWSGGSYIPKKTASNDMLLRSAA